MARGTGEDSSYLLNYAVITLTRASVFGSWSTAD
jgi:hypothetical protein